MSEAPLLIKTSEDNCLVRSFIYSPTPIKRSMGHPFESPLTCERPGLIRSVSGGTISPFAAETQPKETPSTPSSKSSAFK